MNSEITKVEQFNNLIRAFCVCVLLAVFGIAFLWGVFHSDDKIVSSDAFMGVLGTVLTWWFKSRDEEKRDKQTTVTTPPGGATTVTTQNATVTTGGVTP